MKKIFNNWQIKDKLSLIISVAMVIFFIGIDQLSKMLVVNDSVLSTGIAREIIPGVINFDLCYNTGIAWGMFKNSQWFFAIISFVFGSLFLFYLIFNADLKNNALFTVSLTLIIGGTYGNGIDRAFYSNGVVDFISFEFWPLENFPTFNGADSFICIGAALLVIFVLFIYKEPQKDEGESTNA